MSSRKSRMISRAHFEHPPNAGVLIKQLPLLLLHNNPLFAFLFCLDRSHSMPTTQTLFIQFAVFSGFDSKSSLWLCCRVIRGFSRIPEFLLILNFSKFFCFSEGIRSWISVQYSEESESNTSVLFSLYEQPWTLSLANSSFLCDIHLPNVFRIRHNSRNLKVRSGGVETFSDAYQLTCGWTFQRTGSREKAEHFLQFCGMVRILINGTGRREVAFNNWDIYKDWNYVEEFTKKNFRTLCVSHSHTLSLSLIDNYYTHFIHSNYHFHCLLLLFVFQLSLLIVFMIVAWLVIVIISWESDRKYRIF